MRPSPSLLLALAACATPAPLAPTIAPRAPVAAPCEPDRIARVSITGAPPDAVAQLAVLDGTRDVPERTARIAEAATDALRARGYARAQIALDRAFGCGVELRAAVTLGPRYRIARIEFETGDDFPEQTRLAVLEDALGTVNTIGGSYIEYRFIRGLRELKRRYQEGGWLDVRVAPPRATYHDDGTVDVRVAVRSGPRYRIGSLVARGAGPNARAALLASLGFAPGDYYDAPALRVALDRARARLSRRVELRTNISPDRAEIELEAVVETRP